MKAIVRVNRIAWLRNMRNGTFLFPTSECPKVYEQPYIAKFTNETHFTEVYPDAKFIPGIRYDQVGTAYPVSFTDHIFVNN